MTDFAAQLTRHGLMRAGTAQPAAGGPSSRDLLRTGTHEIVFEVFGGGSDPPTRFTTSTSRWAGPIGQPRMLDSVATGASTDLLGAARVWLDSAAELPDAGLASWTSRIGGVPIRFRCTDPGLAHLYRSRLVGHDPKPLQTPFLRLDLLEDRRLGWASPDSAADRRCDPSDLARRFARARLAALMPPVTGDSRYPWVFFDPVTRRGVMLVRTAADLPAVGGRRAVRAPPPSRVRMARLALPACGCARVGHGRGAPGRSRWIWEVRHYRRRITPRTRDHGR